jgi:hypothetical protein
VADLAINTIIALVQTGITCCRAAKLYKDDVERIGTRLMLVLSKTHYWTEDLHTKADGGRAISQALNKALQDVILCVRSTTSKGDNRSKLKRKMMCFFLAKAYIKSY